MGNLEHIDAYRAWQKRSASPDDDWMQDLEREGHDLARWLYKHDIHIKDEVHVTGDPYTAPQHAR
eukprot:gene13497-3943_t